MLRREGKNEYNYGIVFEVLDNRSGVGEGDEPRGEIWLVREQKDGQKDGAHQ